MDFENTFETVLAKAGVLNSKLSQIDGKGEAALELKATKELKGTFGGGEWTYGIGATGGSSVHVLVSKEDVDPDAIFGPVSAETTKASAVLNPTPGKAWVKYALAGGATAKVGSSKGYSKIELSAGAKVGLGAYCPAASSATLIQALGGGIPFVLDVNDVRQLKPGQAAYVAVGGTLSAKLEFNWADVLTGPITPLQGLISGKNPLNLAVDLKAGFAVALTISDSFRLVFSGVDGDYVAVALNRASSSAFSVKADVNATVRLEKPDMARDVLANLAAQLLGLERSKLAAARGELEKVLGLYDTAVEKVRAEIAGVADKLDAAIDAQGLPLFLTRLQQLQALTRVGGDANPAGTALGLTLDQVAKAAGAIDGVAGKLEELVGDKLDELLASLKLPKLSQDASKAANGLLEQIDKIEAALLKIARKRIEIGLSFEYRRIASDASVMKAKLLRSHPDFGQWHRSLLSLDAIPVLAASSPVNRNVVLDLFLNQKSVKRTISLGIDLGWFYSDKDTAETEWTESTRIVAGASVNAPHQVERRLTLKGSRSREETSLGTPAECSGQFDADFVASGTANAAGRWNFALNLSYASQTREATRPWLMALADYACVWGVINEGEMGWLVDTLEDDGAIGEKVDMEIAFTIDRAAFAHPSFFAAFGTVSDAELSRALAIALQRMEEYPERASPASRAATYAKAISVLLGKSGVDVTAARPIARFVALNLIGASSSLKAFERKHLDPIPRGSVAYVTQHTGSALGEVTQFKKAKALHALAGVAAQGSAAERELVDEAFKGLDLAWRDRFLLRCQVSLLRSLAAQVGVAHATSSTLRVTVGTRGKARLFAPRQI